MTGLVFLIVMLAAISISIVASFILKKNFIENNHEEDRNNHEEDKNNHEEDKNNVKFQMPDQNMSNVSFPFLGRETVGVAIICLTILICLFLLLYHPSGTSLINVTVGNGTIDSEPPVETLLPAPVESEPPVETKLIEGWDKTIYHVTADNLRLRKSPSVESDVLMTLPYGCEVISEGRTDERGWMPVRVELPNCVFYGYVFAAYLDPIF